MNYNLNEYTKVEIEILIVSCHCTLKSVKLANQIIQNKNYVERQDSYETVENTTNEID